MRILKKKPHELNLRKFNDQNVAGISSCEMLERKKIHRKFFFFNLINILQSIATNQKE